MPNVRTFSKSFAGGEVTPEFFGRLDDAKFQTGLSKCRNFITTPHGPAYNRAGTTFVRAARYAAKKAVVRAFSYSTEQTMVLEFGDLYVRFHTQGATLLAGAPAAWSNATAYAVGDMASSGGVNYYAIQAGTNHAVSDAAYWYALPSAAYEIPSPYLEADLATLKFVQSADVLTITHPNYAPRELRRLGATKWVLALIPFASPLAAPTGVSATPTTTGGAAVDHVYVVSALDADGLSESALSATATASNNLNSIGAFNTVSWSAVAGAARYNVYKLSAGQYGYVGQTEALTLKDDNITPDIGHTPPQSEDPFNAAGKYPRCATYFEQRRGFASTLEQPQTLWLTRSATESDLSYSIPSRDDDSIVYKIAARDNQTIRHMVPLASLLLLTSSGEWRVTAANSDILTPFTFAPKQQSGIGASDVTPLVINNNVIFAANRGGHVREMAYANEGGGYVTGDISLRAPHLFDGKSIVDMALAKSPLPIAWCVSSNGQLLGLTYVPEQQVGAWHRHDTALGAFESICVVAEGAEDHLYAVVRRTINGQTVRYVERMEHRFYAAVNDEGELEADSEDVADAYFVDCGARYDGAPIKIVNMGISHLEGCTVSILGDGAVRPPQVVTAGTVTLDEPASVIQIGLPITADARLLPLAIDIQGLGQGRVKNVNKVWVRVFASGAIKTGPSFSKLTESKARTTEVFGQPPRLESREVPVVVLPSWEETAQLCIRQDQPRPCTLTSLSMEVAIGG